MMIIKVIPKLRRLFHVLPAWLATEKTGCFTVSPYFLIYGTGNMNPGGFNLDSVVLLGILEGSFQDKDREDKKKLW